MKNTSKKSKQEILDIIVNHFESVKEDYFTTCKSGEYPEFLIERKFGSYNGMMDLLKQLEIYSK